MLVEMKNIMMRFGPVVALDNVDFSVQPSEIHGLLGENGAGKTTLMNILAGSFAPSSGTVYIDGQQCVINNPQKSAKLGIRFIHQELNLCNDLSVYENMFLAQELHKFGWLGKKLMVQKAAEVFAGMKVDIDPHAVVGTLQPAQKQLVEIARALLFSSRLIIMDEPTTALTSRETDNLFATIRQLKSEGVSFIYISHKMPELFEICDSYTVLRDGRFIASGSVKETTEKEITALLVGREFVTADKKEQARPSKTEKVLLEARGLTCDAFSDINLQLRRGEIVAVTGLTGSGSAELADALFGIIPFTGGSLFIKGFYIKSGCSIRSIMKKGLALVPRSRKERGILNDLSICDNTMMAYYNIKQKSPFISQKMIRARYKRQAESLNIKAGNPKNPITSLSGGNQQKVILGRWLEAGADIYLLDNPTQGIDVGTKFELYKMILALAQQGKAILMFSNEFPEIYEVADSCVVLYKGTVSAVLSRQEMSEGKIMYYSTGAGLEVAR